MSYRQSDVYGQAVRDIHPSLEEFAQHVAGLLVERYLARKHTESKEA